MPRFYRLSIVVLLVVVVAAVLVWTARRPLSVAAVDGWLGSQGVAARYTITQLSPSSVTLAGVALGSAAAPDFTAERVDADLTWAWSTPTFKRVRLLRPRLQGRLTDRGLRFGSVDALIPASPPGTLLPDIAIEIVDGRMVLATPAGPLSARVDGRGRLRDGFRAHAVLAPASLRRAGCTAETGAGTLDIALDTTSSRITGAGRMARADCAGRGAADGVGWRLAATLPPALDSYRARVVANAARLTADGYTAGPATLTADAAARLPGPVTGTLALSATRIAGPAAAASRLTATGSYRFDGGRFALDADAALGGASYALPVARLRKLAQPAGGTLAQPLLEALTARAAAAARRFDVSAHVATTPGGEIRVTRTLARAASGATLAQTGAIVASADGAALAGGVTIAGGGFPAAMLSGDAGWAGHRLDGTATLVSARFSTGSATLDALRLTATADATGTMLTGGVRVSGALGGGIAARQLGVPVALRLGPGGALAFGDRCLAVDWRGLARGTASLAPGTVRLCPAGAAMLTLANGQLRGGIASAPLRLQGRDGTTPVEFVSAPIRLDLAGTIARPRVALRAVALSATLPAGQLRATLAGRFDIAAATGDGTVAGASLAAPGLPVRADAAAAGWSWRGDRVSLANATVRLADRAAPARFEPLRLTGVTADFAGGRLSARGDARLDKGGARLLGFAVTHDITTARGTATLATGPLMFGPALQPYQITESLRGIIDNVRGAVIGTGRFDWTASTTTSSGTIKLDNLALATASLGPVDGIAGTLAFDDLVALTTPPGQRLRIARLNPGVAVDDGEAVFQLLGPDAVAIEAMRWPYAGGSLTLAPVTLRATDPRRILKLTVDNLDAEAFLQKFEIKNLNLTGRFDGTLPLLFEGGKGRIVGGQLVARQGGGVLQYVGDLGGSDMGASAQLAFDALRRLRYRSLILELDGALDGELVTQLRFAGTNEAATRLGGGPLPIRATGLPFKFNIQVRAPFRALLGTAASFSDVRPLLRAPADADKPAPVPPGPVQPP